MSKRILKNIDHSFDVEVGDVGCTVRKGERWSFAEPGELIELWNCKEPHSGDCVGSCKKEGLGKIIGHWCGDFGKIPSSLLSIEHNVKARDISVLKDMMITGYGSISDTDKVTVLIYLRIEKE